MVGCYDIVAIAVDSILHWSSVGLYLDRDVPELTCTMKIIIIVPAEKHTTSSNTFTHHKSPTYRLPYFYTPIIGASVASPILVTSVDNFSVCRCMYVCM